MTDTWANEWLTVVGAGCFGAVVGWYVYYINRYRKGDVQLSDIVTLIGAIGGSAVTALFTPRSDLFGAYGIGLAVGFFTYFVTLIVLVSISNNFDVDWFLDGRCKVLGPGYGYSGERPMLVRPETVMPTPAQASE